MWVMAQLDGRHGWRKEKEVQSKDAFVDKWRCWSEHTGDGLCALFRWYAMLSIILIHVMSPTGCQNEGNGFVEESEVS